MNIARLALGMWVLAIAAAAPVGAQSEQVMSRDGISFVSGAVGAGSRERLKALETQFNLKLVFTLVEGSYIADVNVVVKDARGKNLVEHFVEGPIFMVRLPAGAYTVSATYEGAAQTRKVKLSDRLRTEYLRWPSKPGVDFPLPPESRRER